MKRILINATHNEEIRVALCKDNHMYDFDLENRTREQKKANIYKAHVTRVEPSLEAVFVEYGSKRQGFLPIREIAKEYLSGKRGDNVRDLIKEGDTLIVQIEKEERGNKGAALSTFVSLAGRYLVLMPNNPRGGGISRQISGKMREDMKRIVANLEMPQGMSVIIRTAGIGKTQEDLQHDLSHLLTIWTSISEQNEKYESPRLVHQEAGVVTRAVRDYLRDDISEIWIDNEDAYNEASTFISAVMPKQADKLRKYTDFEPMLARFGIEKQIETAYQREVRLPSGGSIVIDQTEAMVAIDINSAKSKKGADVSGTAYHTNLEAAEEIARQLRLRDMGGLVVIDFIDMYETEHQKEVEKRLIDATKYDRARVQFGNISKFGLMEMSRQRLRPSLEESTGFKCPRCHGNGMIRDLRSLGLSIMRQIEQTALSRRQGEIQAEVPTDIAAFLLNEKRDSLVYLEQDSGTRITILPHAHMESPDFQLHYNPEGFAPSSYERINDSEEQEANDRGYEINWQTAENERPKSQPTRQPRPKHHKPQESNNKVVAANTVQTPVVANSAPTTKVISTPATNNVVAATNTTAPAQPVQADKQAIAWLSNLFAPTQQATLSDRVSSQDAAGAIEAIVNQGGQSLGAFGHVDNSVFNQQVNSAQPTSNNTTTSNTPNESATPLSNEEGTGAEEKEQQLTARKPKNDKGRYKKERKHHKNKPKYQNGSLENEETKPVETKQVEIVATAPKERRTANSKRDSRGEFPRTETISTLETQAAPKNLSNNDKTESRTENRSDNRVNKPYSKHPKHVKKPHTANDVNVHVSSNEEKKETANVVHVSLDDNKAHKNTRPVDKDLTKDKPVSKEVPQRVTNDVKISETTDTVIVSEIVEVNPTSTGVATIDAIQTALAIDPQPRDARADNQVSSELKEQPVEVIEQNTPAVDKNDVDKKTNVTTEIAVEKTVKEVANLRADGRIANDPRVVLETLERQNTASIAVSKPSHQKVQTTTKAITGTVGTFIREVLEDAESKLADEGVISCFLAAVNQLNDSNDIVNSSDNNTEVVNEVDFDFSNYGYKALETDYLVSFGKMTRAVASFSASQGKTQVAELVTGTRVSNDPRISDTDAVSTETMAVAVGCDHTVTECKNTDISTSTTTDSADNSSVVSAHTETTDEAVVAEKTTEANSSKTETATENDNSTSKDRPKTTFDKYKSMLANVSEQMLGNGGSTSLLLSSQPVPKMRTRKAKKDS